MQELLQGFRGAKNRDAILKRFRAFAWIVPKREDHIAAAELWNRCRRKGVQMGTVDILLVQLCIRHSLTMLSADADFRHASQHVPLKVWTGAPL